MNPGVSRSDLEITNSRFEILCMPAFFHHDLELLNPTFDSELVDVLSELEHLRKLRLEGDTPAPVFFQLKSIFHTLESLGSARIEGNHTTLADYIDSKVGGQNEDTDQLREVANIEKAMDYIEERITHGSQLTEHFIRELHAMTVHDLDREGTKRRGRTDRVRYEYLNQSIYHLTHSLFLDTCEIWSSSLTNPTPRSMTS
jgi:Fic family protein